MTLTIPPCLPQSTRTLPFLISKCWPSSPFSFPLITPLPLLLTLRCPPIFQTATVAGVQAAHLATDLNEQSVYVIKLLPLFFWGQWHASGGAVVCKAFSLLNYSKQTATQQGNKPSIEGDKYLPDIARNSKRERERVSE